VKIRLLKAIDAFLGTLLARALPGLSPGEEKAGPPASILLIRPGGIGDAILLLPVVRALKKAYPRAAIDVLAEKRNGQGFSFSPHVRRIFLYDRGPDLWAVLRRRYDVVIDTEQWHRLSAVVARLIRSSRKIGFGTNERKKLFTHAIPYAHEDYEADSFFHLVAPLGLTPPAALETPFIEIASAARKRAGELLGEVRLRPFVVLFPGASIPERRWGAQKFRDVVLALANAGVASVIVGGGEDADEGAKIVTGTPGLNLAGQTSLPETAALIDQSSVLVSGDSGVLHLGAALGKPTVSLFGPGIVKKWAPRGPQHIVLNKNLPCSPCTKFGYTLECSSGAPCLQEITVEEVAESVLKLLLPSGVAAELTKRR
jgi:lipopolysaccharide heptosyltransferase II